MDIVPVPPPEQPASTPPPAAQRAPGWYNTSRPGVQRWWTGAEWSQYDRKVARPITVQPMLPQFAAPAAKRPVNHPLHFVLTLLTFGLWLPVWLIVAIAA